VSEQNEFERRRTGWLSFVPPPEACTMTRLLSTLALVTALAVAAFNGAADAQQPKGKTTAPPAVKEAPSAAASGTTIEIYKDRGGDFRFRNKSSDGTILAMSSKGYGTRTNARKSSTRSRRTRPKPRRATRRGSSRVRRGGRLNGPPAHVLRRRMSRNVAMPSKVRL
jgi:uncharacterized protein YegP (UPF0339 family)